MRVITFGVSGGPVMGIAAHDDVEVIDLTKYGAEGFPGVGVGVLPFPDGTVFPGPPPWTLPTATNATLQAYAIKTQAAVAAEGITISSAGTGSLVWKTDPASIQAINTKLGRLNQFDTPTASFVWTGFNPLTSFTVTPTQFKAAALKIADYVQATVTLLGSIQSDINASVITTTAQIDGAAWPSNAQ